MTRYRLAPMLVTITATVVFPELCRSSDTPTIRVGSKTFTESVVLGEIAAALIESTGADAIHQREFGGTRILFHALATGEIDVYPEYTGTLTHEIFSGEALSTTNDIKAALSIRGLTMTAPLGFNNTYALGMTESRSGELGVTNISDLLDHPKLVLGFSNEFLNRDDGWPALRDRYGLPQRSVTGLAHDIAYRGLRSGSLDVIDLYTTDAEIAYYGLVALDDDLRHFPEYHAVFLYRADLDERAATALERLSGRVNAETMTRLNARAKIDRVPEAIVANEFVAESLNIDADRVVETTAESIWRTTKEHLFLVSISTGAAILFAIPIGVIAAKRPRLGQVLLGAVGIGQTIPSLALLVLLMPILAAVGLRSVGAPPAIIALFVYSLLPIVRNTHAGITGISLPLRESAAALGLSKWATLIQIELPLAGRSILAGIKIASVINVGFATLGALIAAGGYGQPILTGIRLNDHGLILQGAIPAALLALTVQTAFDLLERWIIPAPLRT